MILCDTNILIEFYKGNPTIIQALKQLGPAQLAVSIVTQAELYYGALNKAELQQIKQHLAQLRQLPVDHQISALFLELIESYALSHNLNLPDALIAATALVHGLPLYTLNRKDFHYIPDLQLHEAG
jgi:predicted nucleic acid-binding protein